LDIELGGYHTCVAFDVGGVFCWGYNMTGSLGDGSTAERTIPVAAIAPCR
jgi:hypothetical protein